MCCCCSRTGCIILLHIGSRHASYPLKWPILAPGLFDYRCIIHNYIAIVCRGLYRILDKYRAHTRSPRLIAIYCQAHHNAPTTTATIDELRGLGPRRHRRRQTIAAAAVSRARVIATNPRPAVVAAAAACKPRRHPPHTISHV